MANNFSFALNQALGGLEMTQLSFANAVGISHSMITKLLAGEEAHRKTYVKIFAFLRKEPSRELVAKELMLAHLRDVVSGIGMENEYDGAELAVSTSGEAAISHIFRGLPPSILAAFYAIGAIAKRNDAVYNSLMSLAELACEIQPQGGGGFPKHWFSAALRKPAGSKRLLGGSLGDLLLKISSPDEQ